MITKYSQFIKENHSDIKSDLVKYIDDNKSDIESKGLYFNELKEDITSIIERLDSKFLESINLKLSSIDINDKVEFQHKFEEVIKSIIQELDKSQLNESIVSFFKSIWNEIKKAVKWVSDRIYTISGYLTIGLAGLLFIINQWGSGLSMPYEFGNVAINTVLSVGILILKYGQKNDNYIKNISEI
jgi:hypothetical protein